MIILKKGDKAPEFSSTDQNGEVITLNDYNGKKVILFFYPKDMTPGCTTQSCNLRDNYTQLLERGIDVIGVSMDNEKKHLKFADKYNLPFKLLADTDKKIISEYGVWGLKKFMGREYEGINRTTFLIDENGKIEEVFEKVITKSHTEQIIEVIENNK